MGVLKGKLILYLLPSKYFCLTKFKFSNGEFFVSGGEDKEVKIWHYDEGECRYLGFGHSNGINKVAISPNQEFIISVGCDGSIFFWETPEEISCAK